MHIGLIGGSGKEGRGLALRWARAGHRVVVGSRDAERGRAAAVELSDKVGRPIEGGGNELAAACEIVALCVPYAAQHDTLRPLAAALEGKILIDLVVPLVPPQVNRVQMPAGGAAALEAQVLLPRTRVVGALHHISSVHLSDLGHVMEGDVLICSDDRAATDLVVDLVADFGMRGLDAGPLANAVALEAMTSVLIHMNKRYKQTGLGLRVVGFDGAGR